MVLSLLAGGVLVACIIFLILRRKKTTTTATTFLRVDMYYKPTPSTSGWLQTHVLLPLGIKDADIDSTALTVAAAQLHHAGQQVAELRVQYIAGQRCARRCVNV